MSGETITISALAPAAISAVVLVASGGLISSSDSVHLKKYEAIAQVETEKIVRDYAARKHAESQAEHRVKSARIEAAWERGMERQRVKNLQYIEDHKKDFSFGWGAWTHAETAEVGRGFKK